MRRLLMLAGLWCSISSAALPPNSVPLLPVVQQVQTQMWPDHIQPWLLASQIEAESCISLKHRRCWSPTSELKTDREYGFGLAQVTVAYNKNGTERFNNFKMLQQNVPELKDWSWSQRYDARRQLIGFVWMMKKGWNSVAFAPDCLDRYAFALNAYNGGLGGLLKDRTLCRSIKGCDPNRWWSHVENYSTKSKVAAHGYGKSFFEISRMYPKTVMYERSDKYKQWWIQNGY